MLRLNSHSFSQHNLYTKRVGLSRYKKTNWSFSSSFAGLELSAIQTDADRRSNNAKTTPSSICSQDAKMHLWTISPVAAAASDSDK